MILNSCVERELHPNEIIGDILSLAEVRVKKSEEELFNKPYYLPYHFLYKNQEKDYFEPLSRYSSLIVLKNCVFLSNDKTRVESWGISLHSDKKSRLNDEYVIDMEDLLANSFVSNLHITDKNETGDVNTKKEISKKSKTKRKVCFKTHHFLSILILGENFSQI